MNYSTGLDHVPENKRWYANERYQALKDVGPANLNVKPVLSRCRWKEGNTEWVVDRVGPMRSTGGYDWWQVGWPDVGGLSEVLSNRNGIGIIGMANTP